MNLLRQSGGCGGRRGTVVVVAAVHFVFSILFGCVSMLASIVVRFLEHIRFLTKFTEICVHSWRSFLSTNNIIALNFRLNDTLARMTLWPE